MYHVGTNKGIRKFKTCFKNWCQKILNLTLTICGIKHQASYFSVLWMLCKGRRRRAEIVCLSLSPWFRTCKLHITALGMVHLLPRSKRLFACAIYASLSTEIMSPCIYVREDPISLSMEITSVRGDYVALYLCPWGSHISVRGDNTCPWRLCLSLFLSVGISHLCPWR